MIVIRGKPTPVSVAAIEMNSRKFTLAASLSSSPYLVPPTSLLAESDGRRVTQSRSEKMIEVARKK